MSRQPAWFPRRCITAASSRLATVMPDRVTMAIAPRVAAIPTANQVVDAATVTADTTVDVIRAADAIRAMNVVGAVVHRAAIGFWQN